MALSIKPFALRNEQLCETQDGDLIAANILSGHGRVDDNDDISRPFTYQMFDVPYQNSKTLLKIDGIKLVESFEIQSPALQDSLVKRVRSDLRDLPRPRYEIWHRDHNLSDDVHLPDANGNATRLLDTLRQSVQVLEPPVNHNKVSSKFEDRFGTNHLHLDSFEGMRTDIHGKRQVIDRYFFNLDLKPRDILIAAISPTRVDQLVPLSYKSGLLDDLFGACGHEIPLLRFTTPPYDPSAARVYGLKIRSTHAIHSEYGAKDDLLAIVNTLP